MGFIGRSPRSWATGREPAATARAGAFEHRSILQNVARLSNDRYLGLAHASAWMRDSPAGVIVLTVDRVTLLRPPPGHADAGPRPPSLPLGAQSNSAMTA